MLDEALAHGERLMMADVTSLLRVQDAGAPIVRGAQGLCLISTWHLSVCDEFQYDGGGTRPGQVWPLFLTMCSMSEGLYHAVGSGLPQSYLMRSASGWRTGTRVAPHRRPRRWLVRRRGVAHGGEYQPLSGLPDQLDVLDGLEKSLFAWLYDDSGETVANPIDAVDYENLRPVYETLPGWSESTVGLKSLDALPASRLISAD